MPFTINRAVIIPLLNNHSKASLNNSIIYLPVYRFGNASSLRSFGVVGIHPSPY